MTTTPETLSSIPLAKGQHEAGSPHRCIMECVAYIAGEEHSDHPLCACDVVAAVAIQANDTRLPGLAAGLSQRILRLAGSNKGEAVTKERAYFLADMIFRTLMPELLRQRAATLEPGARGLYLRQAQWMAAIPPIRLETELHKARSVWYATEADGLLAHGHPARRHLTDVLYKLRIDEFRSVGETFGEVDNALDRPFDILAVLDALLDVGATAPVDLTPAMKVRLKNISSSADLPQPALAD